MSTADPQTLAADEINVVAAAHRQTREYDRMIDREKQAFSTWFVAASVAGFSLAITQEDVLLDGSQLARRLLVTGALVFLASILVGTFARHLGNRYHLRSRQLMTLENMQYSSLYLAPSRVTTPDDLRQLTGRVGNGHYLPCDAQDNFKSLNDKKNHIESLRKWTWRAQQVLVMAGYVAITSLFVMNQLG